VDEHTGLANRREAQEWLEQRSREADLRSEAFSIALIDIDLMSQINRSHGYVVGDVVLRRLADLIRGATGATDLAARLGGEEFLLAWPGDGALEAAAEVDDLRARFHELEIELEDGTRAGGFTLSAGVTQLASLNRHQADGNIAEGLIANADRALYEAKNDGRNCVRIF
jgi:diguanylate cyclase (GGDEF)-like protein